MELLKFKLNFVAGKSERTLRIQLHTNTRSSGRAAVVLFIPAAKRRERQLANVRN